jgi:hypothetical protein
MLIGPPEGSGTSAYADLPFAAFVTAATVLLGRSLERPDTWRTLLAGLLLGAALATKQEGMLWAAALGFAVLLTLWRRPGARTTGVALGVAAAAIPALLFLALRLAASRWTPRAAWSERYDVVLDLDWLRQLGSRPFEVVPFVLKQVVDWKAWGWGWLIVLAGLLFLRRPRLTPTAFLWRATALAVFAADFGVFVVTPNHVHWHLATALSRLLLQLYPLAILILVEQVGASGWPGPGPGATEARE